MRVLRLLALVLVAIGVSFGQGVQTVIFQAQLNPANEVPPVTGVEASGIGTLSLHLTRDANNAIVYGIAEFDVNFAFTGAINFTGLHIHGAPAGSNAGIVIGTDLSPANPLVHPGGNGRVIKQVFVSDAALLQRVIDQPDQFYMNMHTTANPGGVMRAQLVRAEVAVFRQKMLPQNEVPPVNLNGDSSSQITAIFTRDGSGTINGGVVNFDISYRFPTAVDITGLHIHNNRAGLNGGVVIGTDLSGTNNLPGQTTGRVEKQVWIRTQLQLDNLRGLMVNPAGFYVNIHTNVNGQGAMRAQLQPTGVISLRTPIETSQEVPANTVDATGAAAITAYVTRNAQGRITAAMVVFDVNHRFAGETNITGLHIHRAAAGSNGGIVIESGVSNTNPIASTSGTGNITRFVAVDDANAAALTALNDLVANPGGFYVNLHTSTNPGGVMRGQLGTAALAPQINANGIINAAGDARIISAAPGTIVSLYGTNLAGTTSDTGGMEVRAVPIGLNGTEVRIGVRQAPIFFVSPTQINAQVPYETPIGDAQVFVVRPGDVFSAPYTLRIVSAAPGVFVTQFGGAVLKNTDFSLVTPANPASANDVLSIFCTGLGSVTPAGQSGSLAPDSPLSLVVAKPSVTVGGRDAEVLASALAPGFAGLYQVAIRVPAGVSAGNQALVVTAGGEESNSTTIAIR